MLYRSPTWHLSRTSAPIKVMFLCNETVVLLSISKNAYMKIIGLMVRKPSSELWGTSTVAFVVPIFSTGEGTFPQLLVQVVSMPPSLKTKGLSLLSILN